MGKGKRNRANRKESMSENPTPEEVAALLNGLNSPPEEHTPSQLEIAVGGRLLLVQIPARLSFKDDRPDYIVNDLAAWGYTPFGILAVGNFEDAPEDAPEESKVFAGDVVDNITFNKTRYEEIIEEIKAEEEAEEAADVSDDGTGETEAASDDLADEEKVAVAA